jgi:hypothetical protein
MAHISRSTARPVRRTRGTAAGGGCGAHGYQRIHHEKQGRCGIIPRIAGRAGADPGGAQFGT